MFRFDLFPIGRMADGRTLYVHVACLAWLDSLLPRRLSVMMFATAEV